MSQSREPHDPFVRHGDQLEQFLQRFWQRQVDAAENEPPPYGRHPPLPLARIKKVMKSDPDVRMIASDAPVLFCKACEIFIQEITCRAFLVADAHKRRTISKADIAKALAKSDHFDFLIDVVPRDEAERAKTQKAINSSLEAEAHERAAAEAAMTAQPGASMHHQQGQISPTSQQHSPMSHVMYQQQGHMSMSHHMQPPPQPGVHQGAPSMHQHQHPGAGRAQQHPPPPPLNLSMPSHHNGRPHSHSHSQSQPPPLIPNIRSPTASNHPHNGNPHQQHQQHANARRPSVTRMSMSPTIPLSSSRMDPPSLDMNGR